MLTSYKLFYYEQQASDLMGEVSTFSTGSMSHFNFHFSFFFFSYKNNQSICNMCIMQLKFSVVKLVN